MWGVRWVGRNKAIGSVTALVIKPWRCMSCCHGWECFSAVKCSFSVCRFFRFISLCFHGWKMVGFWIDFPLTLVQQGPLVDLYSMYLLFFFSINQRKCMSDVCQICKWSWVFSAYLLNVEGDGTKQTKINFFSLQYGLCYFTKTNTQSRRAVTRSFLFFWCLHVLPDWIAGNHYVVMTAVLSPWLDKVLESYSSLLQNLEYCLFT